MKIIKVLANDPPLTGILDYFMLRIWIVIILILGYATLNDGSTFLKPSSTLLTTPSFSSSYMPSNTLNTNNNNNNHNSNGNKLLSQRKFLISPQFSSSSSTSLLSSLSSSSFQSFSSSAAASATSSLSSSSTFSVSETPSSPFLQLLSSSLSIPSSNSSSSSIRSSSSSSSSSTNLKLNQNEHNVVVVNEIHDNNGITSNNNNNITITSYMVNGNGIVDDNDGDGGGGGGGGSGIASGSSLSNTLNSNNNNSHNSIVLSNKLNYDLALTDNSDNLLEEIYNTPMYFGTENSTLVTAQIGATAHIPCTIHHIGKGVVSWIRKKDYHLLTVGLTTYSSDGRFSCTHLHHSEDWTLQIKYVQTKDAGIYECQVSTYPSTSIFIHLKVVEARAEIVGPTVKYLTPGSTLRLICRIVQSTETSAFIFWYHNNRMINYDVDRGINVSTESDYHYSELTILKASKEHSGNYSCVGSNAQPASVIVHIFKGDNPAAMHHEHRSSSNQLSYHQQLITFVIILEFVKNFIFVLIRVK